MSDKNTPATVKHTPAPSDADNKSTAGNATGRAADLDYSFPPDDPSAMPPVEEENFNNDGQEEASATKLSPSAAAGGAGALPGEAASSYKPADEEEDEEEDAPDDEEDDDPDDSDEEEDEEDDDDGKEQKSQTILDHFRELQTRLIRSCILLIIGFGICWFFHNDLIELISQPLTEALKEKGLHAQSTGLPESFLTHMKVAIIAGMFLMSPFIFYQIWSFIAPGLYDNEKRFIVPVAIGSGLCFIAGGLFCYFVVFPNAFRFFISYSDEIYQLTPKMSDYIGLTLKLIFGFGLIFEMPIFCMFLGRMGLIKAASMRRFRRYFIVIAFIMGAFLTPPDPVSQFLMAGPMLLLYEISILVVLLTGKKEKKEPDDDEGDEDGEEEEDDDEAKSRA